MKRLNGSKKILLSLMTSFILLATIQKSNSTSDNFRLLAEDERTEGVNENCMAISDYDLFDLSPLNNLTRFLMQDNQVIQVQFCKNIEGTKHSVIYTGPENEKIYLAGDINGESDSKNKVKVINNNEDAQKGNLTTKVILHLAKGEQCIPNPSEFYDFSIELTCDTTTTDTFVSINSYNPKETCKFIYQIRSKYACGEVDKYEISKILGENNVKIGIILAVIGPLLAIFGYKYIKYAIFVVCIIVFPIVGLFLFYGLFGVKNDIALYIIILVFFGIGIGIAFLITRKHKYLKFYMCIVGGVFGALIGYLIYDVVISLIDTSSQELIFNLLIWASTAAGIVLGIFFPKLTCIVGSSTIGGYALMRAISLFLKNQIPYIDEYQIFDYARTGNYEKIGDMITSWFYIYPFLFVVFAIAFTFIQFKINPKQDDVDDYKDLEGNFEQSAIIKDFKLNNSASEDQENNE